MDGERHLDLGAEFKLARGDSATAHAALERHHRDRQGTDDLADRQHLTQLDFCQISQRLGAAPGVCLLDLPPPPPSQTEPKGEQQPVGRVGDSPTPPYPCDA